METEIGVRGRMDDVVHVLGHFTHATHVAADEMDVGLLGEGCQPRLETLLVARHQVELGVLVVDLVEVGDGFADPRSEKSRAAGHQQTGAVDAPETVQD